MELLQNISLDFGKDTEPVTVFAKQGDAETRYIEIAPLNKGQKYALEAGITARLHITKPDGKIVLSDAAILPETGAIRAELTKQALAVAGIASAEIGLYKDAALLSSQLFYIRIEKRAYSDDALESTDEYKCLVDALNEVKPAVKKAEDAANKAEQQANAAGTAISETKKATQDTLAATAAANKVVANSQAEIGSLQQELTRQKQINKSQDLEIEKLKAAAEGNLYLFKTDSEEAYEKAVLADVMPYATLDKVGGKTLVWNQLLDFSKAQPDEYNNLKMTYSGDNKFRITGRPLSTTYFVIGEFKESLVQNNKYFVFLASEVQSNNDGTYVRIRIENVEGSMIAHSSSANIVSIQSPTKLRVYAQVLPGATVTEEINFNISPLVIDLTAMFGAGNEPATPEEFRAMFPADYYPYSEPTLMNYSSKEVVSRGRNLFNPAAFDGVSDITKDGDEYSGTLEVFHDNFKNGLPLNCKSIPNRVSVSVNARIESVSSSTGNGLYISAKYTDGTLEPILWVPNSANNKNTYTGTSLAEKVIEYLYFSYGNASNNIIHISNIMITAGSTPEPYIPYRSIPYDTSAIVKEYFPDGMKSAGSVHDEIDFERMVAIQRVGSVDLGTLNWTYLDNHAVFQSRSITNVAKINDVQNILCSKYSLAYHSEQSITDKSISLNNLYYGSHLDAVRIKDCAYTDVNDFNAAMSGVILYYELETPVETPIAELFEETIEVEPGGVLKFKNNQGDDFRVPVPNEATFMIKLPNGGTA